MSRVMRRLIIGTATSLLLVGAAMAGPTRTDGDPDRPQITHPDRRTEASVSGAGEQRIAATAGQRQVVADDWKFVLKAYLRLIRVFAL